jgi:hypothetical protein
VLGYANIARRIHNFRLALAILNPVVRSANPSLVATDEEKIEYAESLRKLGAVNEAEQMLRGVNAERNPDALLILAFCHFSKWQYHETLPLLERCIANESLPAYRRTVAKLNLAATYVYLERYDQAVPLLNELKKHTVEFGHKLLHGNVLELLAQTAIAGDQWAQARDQLEQAGRILNEVDSVDGLFVHKWQAILKSLELRAAQPELGQVRERALREQHWETVRECDFYLGLTGADPELLQHLYFGTPFTSYREKIVRRAGPTLSLPEHYIWSQKDGARESLIEVGSGQCAGREGLAEGQLIHRLLIVLSRDFYRPAPLLALFGALFPDEFFNPVSSPNRIHQATKKLRVWLREIQADAELIETEGSYLLKPGQHCGFKLPSEPLSLDQDQLLLAKLARAYGGRSEITARELSKELDVSLATSKRLLLLATRLGDMEMIGGGASSRYRKAS